MVFQSYALYPNMTVGQNITFGLEMHGVPKPERDKALLDVAKLLQIDHLTDRKPGQLSGGQRQRVAMGRALVRDPDVFLFDEPLSNLDAKLRVDMRTEIKKLHAKLKRTIVYVTHDQIEAMTLSTRIAVMNKGYIQQLGTPKEIYDTPANVFVATFMGSPAMNVVPARVVVRDGTPHAEVVLGDGSKSLLAFSQPSLAAWDGGDPARHPPGGDHRSRRCRPQVAEHRQPEEPGDRHRAGRLRHLRHHGPRGQGCDRPHARRCRYIRWRRLRIRSQHGKGRGL